MKSLRITLRTERPIVLPLAYNELIHGLLYKCWSEQAPQLHGFKLEDGRDFRPFVFGRLEGPCRVDKDAKQICFFSRISLDVRSPLDGLIDACAIHLANSGRARIGAYELELVNLECHDRLLFPGRALVRLRTPVVAYVTLDSGHKQPFGPQDPEWLPLIQQNTQRKLAAMGMDGDVSLQSIARTETLKKNVTTFKRTYVTGWTGDIELASDPSVIALLWSCGLGMSNSGGFGLFDIVDFEDRRSRYQ
jgi:CRISPR-associated endoribonuclease Cas6